MKAYKKLKNLITNKNNYLTVGLDTDINKLPTHFPKNLNSLFEFNKAIIDATKDIAIAFKINFAFYEEYGSKGYEVIEKTIDYIPDSLFTIADAKRGDIGNTSRSYAKAIFEKMNFDSITVSPYMGEDSIAPFLEFKDKITFILCLTSNSGSNDFQKLISDEQTIYKHILKTSLTWGNPENVGFVVGATHPEQFREIRSIAKDSVLLIPGVGAQGGSAPDIIKANKKAPALINSSRGIIYASNKEDFAIKAKEKAKELAKTIYHNE